MILANTRARLGREDAQLVVRLVAHGSGRSQDDAEAKLADEGLDPLLDDRPMADCVASILLYVGLRQRGFQLAADRRLAGEHGLAPLFAAAEPFPRWRAS